VAARMPSAAAEDPVGVAFKCHQRPFLAISLSLARSTNKSNTCRKSAPTMGKETAALKKFHWKARPPACSVRTVHPQHGIGLPLAVVILGPVGVSLELYGITEYTEPVSTKKESPVVSSSKSPRRPGRPGCAGTAPAARPSSFPPTYRWLGRRN